MKHKDRVKFCREVFADPLFLRLIPEAGAKDSKALSISLFCIKNRSVLLCTALGRGIHLIRGSLPMLYSKVKSQR